MNIFIRVLKSSIMHFSFFNRINLIISLQYACACFCSSFQECVFSYSKRYFKQNQVFKQFLQVFSVDKTNVITIRRANIVIFRWERKWVLIYFNSRTCPLFQFHLPSLIVALFVSYHFFMDQMIAAFKDELDSIFQGVFVSVD